jgi:hypothetical protein
MKPVSYYFDKEYYSESENLKKLDNDIDITKYVAGGLIVFDLKKMAIKRTQRKYNVN